MDGRLDICNYTVFPQSLQNNFSALFQRHLQDAFCVAIALGTNISLANIMQILSSVTQLVSATSKQNNSRQFESMGKIYGEMRTILHSSHQNNDNIFVSFNGLQI